MNTTKNHTPGEWYCVYGAVWTTPDGPEDGGQCVAMRASNSAINPCERDANMKLCAAAPDLLAACEHAANVFRAEIKDIDPRNELSRNDTPELAAAWHNLETMEKALTKSRTL